MSSANTEAIMAALSMWGLKVLGALVVLVVGLLVARMFRGAVARALRKRDVDATLVPFFSNLVYYLVLAFVLLAVLGLFGIQVASIIAVMGAAAFAIGLALQGTLAHFAAGVMLLIFRPFKVGDFVDVGGAAGSVQEIGIFSTTLHTPDNVKVVVPNATIWGATIKNYAANPTRRNDLVIGVSYADDLGRAAETITNVLKADDRVLADPAPVVAVSELGDSSVNFVVRPWCRKEDYWNLRFDLTRRIKEALEANGCSIPFPQRDVHLFQEKASA